VTSDQAPLYREAWQRDRQPIRVGTSLVIGPPGTRPAAAGDVVIELDLFPNCPATGTVFGTGEHATTRLALTLLETHLRGGGADGPLPRALDVGTGTGILALAAARLGAGEVLAFDIDPLAVMTAEGNVRLNDLEGVVRVRQGSVEVVADAGYDLALANILTPEIRQLAPALRRLLRPEGLLIATGVVAVEADEVAAELAALGFQRVEERREGDWSAFALLRV
jgi:ribosomal protein L11 methyltransferase